MDNLQKIYEMMLARDRHQWLAKDLTRKIAALAKQDARPMTVVMADAKRRCIQRKRDRASS
jgi:hypothetical protein